MLFQKESVGGISIFTVNLKRATMNEAGELKNLLNEEASKGVKQLIIDMSQCEYVDSTFLGVIVAALKKFTADAGDIRLVGFKSSAQSIIDITGTSRIFKVYPTLKLAVSSFKSAA